MRRIGLAVVLTIGLFAMPLVEAQLGRIYGVGVVHQGGLSVRDTKGDLTSVEAAAQSLEAKKVDVILSLATSVTLAVKRATKSVPIGFYGSAPVVLENS